MFTMKNNQLGALSPSKPSEERKSSKSWFEGITDRNSLTDRNSFTDRNSLTDRGSLDSKSGKPTKSWFKSVSNRFLGTTATNDDTKPSDDKIISNPPESTTINQVDLQFFKSEGVDIGDSGFKFQDEDDDDDDEDIKKSSWFNIED